MSLGLSLIISLITVKSAMLCKCALNKYTKQNVTVPELHCNSDNSDKCLRQASIRN